MPSVGGIATEIWDYEFNDHTGVAHRTSEIQSISGWLETNVGQLNTLLYTSFGSGANFQQEESAIFAQLYLKDYYTKEARKTLRNISTASSDWVRLSEGDTTIVRSNRNEVAKTFRLLAQDATEKIKELTYAYNSYQASPRQVAGFDGGYVSGSGAGAQYYYPYYP